MSDDQASTIVSGPPEGRTLGAVLSDGRLDLGRLRSIALRVLDTVEAAHAAAIPHAPLRLETIRVLDGDSVNIASAGTGPSEGPDDTPLQSGSTLYDPPGPILGDEDRDMYALGVVLYQAAAGLAPADDAGPLAMAREHFIRTATPPSALDSTIPSEWDDVIVRALGAGNGTGFRGAAEMRAALASLPSERLTVEEVSFDPLPLRPWEDTEPAAAELPIETLRHWEPGPEMGDRGGRKAVLVMGALIALGIVAGVAALFLIRPADLSRSSKTLAGILPITRASTSVPVLGVPAPLSPAEGASVRKASVRFCWTSVPGAAWYVLRLTPGGSHREGTTCASTTLHPATYAWTVAAIAAGSAGKSGPASKEQSFTVLASLTATPKPHATSRPKPTAHPTSAPAAVVPAAPQPTPTPMPVQAVPPAYVAPAQPAAPVVRAPAPAPVAPAPAPAAPSSPQQGSGSGSNANCIPFVSC